MKKNETDKIPNKGKFKAEWSLETSDFATAIIKNTSDAIVIFNLKGEILFWNKGAEELTGYSKEEVLGKHISLVYRKQDLPSLEERIKNAIQGVNLKNQELILIDKYKKEHTVLLTGNGLKDETGKVTKFVSFTKDITEQNKLKIELIEAKEKAGNKLIKSDLLLAASQKIAKVGGWEFDIDTQVLFWTEETYRIHETSPEEFNPTVDAGVKYFLPASRQIISDALEAALERGEGYDLELETLTTKGRRIDVRTTCEVTLKNGRPAKLMGIFQDITKQKETENHLIKAKEKAVISEKYLDNIINNIGDPVFVKDEQSRLLLANDAFCKLFDLERDSIIGKTLAEDVTPEERESFLKIDKQVLESGQENIIEESLTVRGRQTKIISTRKSRYIDNNGKKHLIGVIRDITKSKLVEDALRASEERFQRLMKQSPIAVQINDPQGNIVDYNQAWMNLFGLTEDMVPEILKNFNMLTDEQNVKLGLIPYFKRAFSGEELDLPPFQYDTRETLERLEIESTSSSRNPWLQAKLYCIKNSQGEIQNVVLLHEDITNRMLYEQNLKKAFNEISELKQQVEAENIYLKEELKLEDSFDEIVGSSKSLKKVLKQVEQVSKTDTTVLILGETGTGKELIARAIHNASYRKDKPMVKVNCSALPAELIESEFFGHEAGAFTNAVKRKIGRFELANGGTIFLDEIGDLPLGLQTRLLRVLQEGEFERVGGEVTIKVNVRVITATNRNLKEEIVKGNFRQDLYYRLNVFPITCPPLRDRIGDIPILVNHFVNKYNNKVHKNIKSINQKSIDRLINYKWPGNVRELEHVIERAVILNQGDQLRLGNWFMNSSNLEDLVPDQLTTLEIVERDYILKVLEKTNWKIRGKNGAAEILGMKPTTLESRMKKRNITR